MLKQIKCLKNIAILTFLFCFAVSCSSNKYTSEDGDKIFSQSSNIEESPNLIGVDIELPRTDFDACMNTTDFAPENSDLSMNSYQNIDVSDYNSYFKNTGKYDFYIHPIICNHKVYKVDTKSANITAYNLGEKGKVKKDWSLSPLTFLEKKGIFITNARLYENNLYISTNTGWIIKVDVGTKKVVWKKQYPSNFTASPTIANGRLFLISTSDEVYAIDIENGELLWKNVNDQNNTTSMQTPPVVLYQDKILVGLANGKIMSLQADSGSVVWENKVVSAKTSGNIVEIADIDFPPVIYSDVVVAGGIKSSVMGFNIHTGQPLWQIGTGLNSYMLRNDDGFGFFVDSDDKNICFDMRTGAIRWIKDGNNNNGIRVEKVVGYLNNDKNSFTKRINRFFDSY